MNAPLRIMVNKVTILCELGMLSVQTGSLCSEKKKKSPRTSTGMLGNTEGMMEGWWEGRVTGGRLRRRHDKCDGRVELGASISWTDEVTSRKNLHHAWRWNGKTILGLGGQMGRRAGKVEGRRGWQMVSHLRLPVLGVKNFWNILVANFTLPHLFC